MKHFLRLTDYTEQELVNIFSIADELEQGKYEDYLKGKTVVLFFSNTSIRTRVTFEKGIAMLGGQSILFPSETLDKKEELRDVIGYLNNWADMIVVRHKSMTVLEEIVTYAKVPVINALTGDNHPCEMMSDLYALSKLREDFHKDHFLFCGLKGNIGLAWKEAAEVFHFKMEQCCPKGYEIEGIKTYEKIEEAIIDKDVVCTDSLSPSTVDLFRPCQVSKVMMEKANKGAILNPCPPFYRGEEVTEDAIDSPYFVGYEFKKHLLRVQQAIMIFCDK